MLSKAKILSFVKDLTLSQTTSFRLSETERVCRQQFLMLMKLVESSLKG